MLTGLSIRDRAERLVHSGLQAALLPLCPHCVRLLQNDGRCDDCDTVWCMVCRQRPSDGCVCRAKDVPYDVLRRSRYRLYGLALGRRWLSHGTVDREINDTIRDTFDWWVGLVAGACRNRDGG